MKGSRGKHDKSKRSIAEQRRGMRLKVMRTTSHLGAAFNLGTTAFNYEENKIKNNN